MSDINAPIQIPSELNVPEPTSENETIEPIKPKSAAPTSAQSADGKHYPKHRLRKEAKSQSMFNFSATQRTTNDGKSDEEEETNGENEENEVGPPTITLSPASSTFRRSAERQSTASLDHIDKLVSETMTTPTVEEQTAKRQISASINEMKLSVNRKRTNSMAPSLHNDDDEFDELKVNGSTGSQLRIRSSIISLFGRMGKMRRTSHISQNSGNENGESNDRPLPLRALPQIAATKIMRAFSYVGKLM